MAGPRGSMSESLTGAALAAALAGNGLDVTPGGTTLFVQPAEIAGKGLVSDGQGPPKIDVKPEVLSSRTVGAQVTDAAASTATAEKPIHINESGVTETVASCDLVNDVARAGDDANNFTLNIFRRNGAAAQATIVTYTNNVASGGLAAWIRKNLGALVNTALLPNEVISFSITKAGTGQALNCRIEIKVTTPG